MSEALQRPSATFMRLCVFGVVSKLAATTELSMCVTFPRWNVSSLSRTSILRDSVGIRSRACVLKRLASLSSPISTLFIVSKTRFQASEDKNPSRVDDDCFIISQEAKQSNSL